MNRGIEEKEERDAGNDARILQRQPRKGGAKAQPDLTARNVSRAGCDLPAHAQVEHEPTSIEERQPDDPYDATSNQVLTKLVGGSGKRACPDNADSNDADDSQRHPAKDTGGTKHSHRHQRSCRMTTSRSYVVDPETVRGVR